MNYLVKKKNYIKVKLISFYILSLILSIIWKNLMFTKFSKLIWNLIFVIF